MFDKPICRILDLGNIDYLKALEVQKNVLASVMSYGADDTLIVCQHPHIITLGRRARGENIIAPQEKLRELGVGVFYTDRGGDVTYHGPGQIIFYPILDLKRHKKDIWFYEI